MNPTSPPASSRFAALAAAGTIVLGLMALGGWLFHLSVLRGVFPGFVPMRVNTAVGLAFLGSAVLLLRQRTPGRLPLVAISTIGIGIGICILGLLTLVEYAWKIDLRIDQAIWRQGPSEPFPGRMSPLTAFNFVCLGSALCLLVRKKAAIGAQVLVLAAFATALTAIVGYFYGVSVLYAAGHASAMAFNTSIAFILLTAAILCLSPRVGLVGLLADQGLGGALTRRFVPAAIFIPFGIGWLRLWGQRQGIFTTETGVTIFCLGSIAAFIAFTWWNARHLFHADASRRQTSARYNLILETLPQMIWTADASGNPTYFNSAWSDYTGLPLAEIINRGRVAIVHPDDLPISTARWENARATGKTYEIEYRLRNASGKYRWHLGRALPLRNAAGEITEWIGTCTDIHGQKHASHELQRWVEIRTEELSNINTHLRSSELKFRAVTQSVPEAIISSNYSGDIIFWNSAAEKIFGYSEREALNKPLAMIVPQDNRRGFLTGFKLLQQTGRARSYGRRLEVIGLHKDGRQFPIDVSVSRWGEEDNEYLTGIIRDITAQKREARELEEAKEAAETANRAKSEFLANMSHEIRTPLNGIIGMTDLVLDEELSPTVRAHLELVKHSGHSLLKLVNEVLDFSKIEAGKLALESVPFSLRGCLASIMGPLEIRAASKHLALLSKIEDDLPLALLGDSTRLAQVLTNLIDNAIKFTAQGQIQLAVCRGNTIGDRLELHFSIRDTGIGIPSEKQRLIFEAFAQADSSTTRTYGGTGLGLGICARIVEMMEGKIWVESEPGLGSTFHFTARFPIAHSALLHSDRAAAVATEVGKSWHILLAEDNPVNRTVAVGMLESMGHVVTVAHDGGEALARQAGTVFDLILMDIQMPVLDGLSVARAIRVQEAESGRRVPIIAMTAHAQMEDERRCLDAGMDSYISKPITKASLAEVIMRTMLEKTARAVALVDVPVIASRETLLRQTDGDAALLQELQNVFRANTPGVLQNMRASIAAHDAKLLERSAHSLLSSFGVFGANRATELTKKLENAGRQADFSGAERELDELERETDRIFTSLAHY